MNPCRDKKSIFWTCICLLLSVTMVWASVPLNDFFPFGLANGDTALNKVDDDFKGPIPLTTPFPFFSQVYNKAFVSNNGVISFLRGIADYTPTCGALNDPNSVMISPFWADIDITRGGNIFFRESNDPNLLQKSYADIFKAFPEFFDLNFVSLFIATWYEAPNYANSCVNSSETYKVNTFQVVLSTDGVHSFTSFYYNKLEWTTGTASQGNCSGLGGTPGKAGFDLGDGNTFYDIPGSCNADILLATERSNVNEPGKWMFRIDNSFEVPDVTTEQITDKPTTTAIRTTTTTVPTTTTTTTAPPAPFSCAGKPDGNYRNEQNCFTFWMCSNGDKHLFECAAANPKLVYHPDYNYCDVQEHAAHFCINGELD